MAAVIGTSIEYFCGCVIAILHFADATIASFELIAAAKAACRAIILNITAVDTALPVGFKRNVSTGLRPKTTATAFTSTKAATTARNRYPFCTITAIVYAVALDCFTGLTSTTTCERKNAKTGNRQKH